MTKWFVTMGGVDYDQYTARVIAGCPSLGYDRVRVYDDVWLKVHPFYELNRWIFETPTKRGLGWHSWKPLLLLDTLAIAADGDVLLYCDADTYPTRDLSPLFERCSREGAVLFDCSGRPQDEWCTGDCYAVMGQEESKYRKAIGGCARFILVKKGDYKALQLLYEWQTYCLNPYANTRQEGYGTRYALNAATFQEHRTEQAILTNLGHKYGYTLYQEASQGSAHTAQYLEQVHCTSGENMSGSNPGCGSKFRNVDLPTVR
jgi:hypothetical protein